jgi:hypothetical protein
LKENSFSATLRARNTSLPRSAYESCRARATSLYRWKNGDPRSSDATSQRPKNDSPRGFQPEKRAGMVSKTHQMLVHASVHRSGNDIFRHAALQNLAQDTSVRRQCTQATLEIRVVATPAAFAATLDTRKSVNPGLIRHAENTSPYRKNELKPMPHARHARTTIICMA